MKKILIVLLLPAFFLTGCLKDAIHGNTDASANIAFYNGGTENMANASLGLAGPDSLIIYIEAGVSTPYTLNKDITITVAVNDAARIAYNQTHTIQYDSL